MHAPQAGAAGNLLHAVRRVPAPAATEEDVLKERREKRGKQRRRGRRAEVTADRAYSSHTAKTASRLSTRQR